MKNFLTIFLVITGMNLSSPARAELFVCEAKSHSQLSESGLVPYEKNKSWVTHIRKLQFDTSSGHLRIKNRGAAGEPYAVLKIIRKGNERGDDFVALNNFGNFLRIRPWAKGMPFFFAWGGLVISGSCKGY